MNWISVKDKLPEQGQEVLAAEYWDNGRFCGMMSLEYKDGKFHDERLMVHADGGDTYLSIEPTHWQPLPEPPTT